VFGSKLFTDCSLRQIAYFSCGLSDLDVVAGVEIFLGRELNRVAAEGGYPLRQLEHRTDIRAVALFVTPRNLRDQVSVLLHVPVDLTQQDITHVGRLSGSERRVPHFRAFLHHPLDEGRGSRRIARPVDPQLIFRPRNFVCMRGRLR
jgi:hypothetical protein